MHHPDKKPMTTMTTIIALVLKQYRLETGLSKNAFAERLNLTASGWNKIENGESVVSIGTLYQFANQYGVRPSNILMTAENCAIFLASNRWDILTKIDSDVTDSLLIKANEFFNSSDHAYIHTDQFGQTIPILNLSIPPRFASYSVEHMLYGEKNY